jgi:hypothetical protein
MSLVDKVMTERLRAFALIVKEVLLWYMLLNSITCCKEIVDERKSQAMQPTS